MFVCCNKTLICTYLVGMCTLAITNPIWVAKTRLCLQYNTCASRSVQFYSGTFDCVYKTYKFEGLKGLYKASQSHEFAVVVVFY